MEILGAGMIFLYPIYGIKIGITIGAALQILKRILIWKGSILNREFAVVAYWILTPFAFVLTYSLCIKGTQISKSLFSCGFFYFGVFIGFLFVHFLMFWVTKPKLDD